MNELDIIINCAASVNFNDRLCDAIEINYNGCLRMLELASECKHLDVLTHVSTCYVNCDKQGSIKENIYPASGEGDPESIMKNIMRMNPD